MSEKELFIKMAVSAWETYCNKLDKLIAGLTEWQLAVETAPGRNTGTYLFGHLIAVNDTFFPLMGWGERLYPELERVFLKSPDRAILPTPSIQELKMYAAVINTKIAEHVSSMQPDDWFTKHTGVPEAVFAREPFRNKLSILISRTNHLSYHLGQMAYLVGKI